MEEFDYFKANWQASPLLIPDQQKVHKLRIDEVSRRFLSEVGLPTRPLFNLFFEFVQQGFPHANLFFDECPSFGCYWLVGKWRHPLVPTFDSRGYVCMDEERHGIVVSVDFETCEEAFFNTDLYRMAQCLLVHDIGRREILEAKSYEEIESAFEQYRVAVEMGEQTAD